MSPERGDSESPRTTLSVSVVVPTRDRLAKISALLDRMLADDGGDQIEFVVVDDGSKDGTPEALARYSATYPNVHHILRSSTAGSSRARHDGVLQATGQLLVLLDDDVMPAPGLVAKHVAHQVGAQDLLVLGYMPTFVPDPLPRGGFATLLYAQEYEKRCAMYETDPDTILTALWLGNASLPRQRYLDAFDSGKLPDFGHVRHEDRILGLVLRELGMHAVFDRSILAQHVHNRPLQYFLSEAYDNGRGRETIRQLYPDVLSTTSEDLYLKGLPGPVRSVFAATRHEPVRKVLVGALRGGIVGAGAVGSRRGEIQLARLVRKIEEWHGARDVENGTAPALH